MITWNALEDVDHKVEHTEIEYDSRIVAELVDYIRWLAEQNSSIPLTIGDVWSLYYEGVRIGRHWSEVCEDLKLPVRTDW